MGQCLDPIPSPIMIIIAIFLLQLATTRLDAASKLDELTSILDGPQKAKLVEEKEKPLGEKIDESKVFFLCFILNHRIER